MPRHTCEKWPVSKIRHAIARRERVHERRFGGAGAGRGKDDDRTGGLEDRAQPFEDFSRQRGELRPAMIDDRMIHGAEDPIGNVGRSWNLEKMPAGMQHENAVYTVRLAATSKPLANLLGAKRLHRRDGRGASGRNDRGDRRAQPRATRPRRRAPADPRTARRTAAPRAAAGADRQRQPEHQTDRHAAERAAQHHARSRRRRSAPSAIRMPISLVRCATE